MKDWDGASYAWVDMDFGGLKVRVKVIGAENLLTGVEAVIDMDVIRGRSCHCERK